MDLSLSLLCVDLEVYNPPNEKYTTQLTMAKVKLKATVVKNTKLLVQY